MSRKQTKESTRNFKMKAGEKGGCEGGRGGGKKNFNNYKSIKNEKRVKLPRSDKTCLHKP